jgi:hypothetical protein
MRRFWFFASALLTALVFWLLLTGGDPRAQTAGAILDVSYYR